jgi:hypothetical protein
MALDTLLGASLLLAMLSMLPAAAHLLELPNNIKLSGTEYLTAQRLYRGWAFAGVGVAAAWLCTLALLFMLRDTPTAFAFAWVAFVCIAGTQIVDWTFARPVNRITADWTFLPGDWLELRYRWEYAQAASAILGLIALVALIGCLFWTNDARRFDIDAARGNYAGAGDRPAQYEKGPAQGGHFVRPADMDRYL